MLDSNHLVELPEAIGELVKLERLSACQNALVSLPASISRLKSLTVLKLTNNKFSAIPDQLSACAALEEIDFSDNYLQVASPTSCSNSKSVGTTLLLSMNKALLVRILISKVRSHCGAG